MKALDGKYQYSYGHLKSFNLTDGVLADIIQESSWFTTLINNLVPQLKIKVALKTALYTLNGVRQTMRRRRSVGPSTAPLKSTALLMNTPTTIKRSFSIERRYRPTTTYTIRPRGTDEADIDSQTVAYLLRHEICLLLVFLVFHYAY